MIVTMNSNPECNLPFSKTSNLSVVIQDMGNPFSEESNVLLVPDTKYIMESFAGSVMKLKNIGQDQCSKSVHKRLSNCMTL